MESLLSIRDLHVRFSRSEGTVHAVNGVSFDVQKGEWLGVLGESGSGKSVTMLSILKLFDKVGTDLHGEALFDGQDLLKMSERQLQSVRGRRIGVVFQNLSGALNPYLRIGDQITEPMVQHGLYTKQAAKQRAITLLQEMGLPDPETQFRNYTFTLSGGMKQRVMMAVAMACEPDLLIADEPTTALDATVQTQVLALLRRTCASRAMTTVMITHDLGVATNVCDRIIVMYGGTIMEVAPVNAFIQRAAHPYTLGLKDSMIDLRERDRGLHPIPGLANTLWQSPQGCTFADRCPLVLDICRQQRPLLRSIADEHQVACHRVEEGVPSVG